LPDQPPFSNVNISEETPPLLVEASASRFLIELAT
jgi:hypothetical protein